MRSILRSEKGTVIILIALGMSVFMGFVGLVVDGGNLYWEKSKLQKAVDAAVLAGVQDLPRYPDKAQTAVISTVKANGIEFEGLTISFNSDFTSINVEARKGVHHTFASAFGFEESKIKAKAASNLMTLTSGIGVIPLGIDKNQELVFGKKVTLKVGTDPILGNFGALDFSNGGGGSNEFENNLKYGYNHELSVGTIISTERGNMNGPTRRGVDARIGACPYSTYDHYSNDCSRIIIVPVYSVIDKFSVKIEGFATFFLERADVRDNIAEVTGRFIQTAQSGTVTGGQSGYGAFGYKLID